MILIKILAELIYLLIWAIIAWGLCKILNKFLFNENGTTQFIGSYTECYYFMFPNVDDDYSDKESFDKAWE